MSEKDPYQILQISPDAEKEVIEAVYKGLARKYHPDRNTHSEATERMKDINWAYEILSDPVKRAAFDRYIEIIRKEKEGSKQQRKQYTENQNAPETQTHYREEENFYANEKDHRKNRKSSASFATLLVLSFILLFVVIYTRRGVNSFLTSLNVVTPTVVRLSNQSQPIILIPSPFPSATIKPLPTATRVQGPTATLKPTPETLSSSNGCINWKSVNSGMAGAEICVFGTMENVPNEVTLPISDPNFDAYSWRLFFSLAPKTFHVRILTWEHDWFTTNDCLAVIGKVIEKNSELFMRVKIENIYYFNLCK